MKRRLRSTSIITANVVLTKFNVTRVGKIINFLVNLGIERVKFYL